MRKRLAHEAWALAVLAGTASAAQMDVMWLGGSGVWNVAGNWSPATVPNNGADTWRVFIDDPADGGWAVTVNQTATIDELTLGVNDSVTIENGRQLRIAGGPVDNAGRIELASTGSNTYFYVQGSAVTLGGGGTVRMSDRAPNWIYGLAGGSLVNADNTIEGGGNVGWAGSPTPIENHALIVANTPTGITVDGSGICTNRGTLRADAGSLLFLTSGTFENSAGLIEALDGSAVLIGATTVRGGTLATAGSGEVRSASANCVLDGDPNAIHNTGVLRAPNGQQIRASGELHNTGTIVIDSTGSNTYFYLNGDVLTLTGGGTLRMSDNSVNWIRALPGGSLVNTDNTIEGGGNVGWAGAPTPIQNDALIVANTVTGITVDGSGVCTNNGTLRADAGSVLFLTGGSFENAAGVIEATDGSAVLIGPTVVRGGTLATAGSGEVRSANANCFLDGVASPVNNTGVLRAPNGQQIRASGELHNTGTIVIDSTGSNTLLYLNGGVLTLTGGGTLRMSDNSVNWIRALPGGSLVNTDNTIEGGGNVGWAGAPTPIQNDALIVANTATGITVDGSGVCTNNGTLRADAGSVLFLTGGSFENAAGVIEATDGSAVLIGPTVVRGGTLATAGSGEVRSANANCFLDGVASPVNNTGALRAPNGQRIRAYGTLHNTGTIAIDSAGSNTYFSPGGGGLTLTGGGTVTLSDRTTNWIYRLSSDPNAVFTNVDNTIVGAGNVGWAGAPTRIVNQGTIHANGTAVMNVGGGAALFDNQGDLLVSGSGGMVLGGSFTTSGSVTVAPGAALHRLTGDYDQTAGVTTVEGVFTVVNNGAIVLDGGELTGGGTVDDVVNTGGVVAPGTSPGTLSVNGNYGQPGGTLRVEIGGLTPDTQHDVLSVSGTATLGGTLEFVVTGGYTPTLGHAFTIVTAGSVSGGFSRLTPVGLLPDQAVRICTTATEAIATIVVRPAGDTDFDGDVDIDDLLLLLSNFGCSGGCDGDTDDDGDADLDDLLRILGSFGAGSPCP